MMIELSKDDKIELNRILESVDGRLNKKLINLTVELIFKTRVMVGKEDHHLFSSNIDRIPSNSLDAFSAGSFFGQTYQISLDIASKMDLKLKSDQKRILREFVLFIVLFKLEKEMNFKK